MENKSSKQRVLFASETPKNNFSSKTYCMYVDGASRGNPGKSGIGIFCFHEEIDKKKIALEETKPVLKKGFYLGHSTNNVCEYMALVCGLFLLTEKLELLGLTAKDKPFLEIYSDSQLMVNQLNGIYKTRDVEIKALKGAVDKLLKHFHWEITHVTRDKNAQADKLANAGIDKKVPLEQNLREFLASEQLLEIFY